MMVVPTLKILDGSRMSVSGLASEVMADTGVVNTSVAAITSVARSASLL